MSNGWYVKVDVPVRFNMDCNIGVVATNERSAKVVGQEIVEAELRKTFQELADNFPWDFETGCLHWTRGSETLTPIWHEIDGVSATPDSDYDPDEPDAGDLMDAAMCLMDAFWNLPEEDERKSNFYPNHGVAVVRDQMASAATYCHQTWALLMEEDYHQSFDFDFVPQFLDACMDEQMVVKSNNISELVKMWKEG